jgi:hypothetical protein
VSPSGRSPTRVRSALLAPADAKKKITHQAAVNPHAPNVCAFNRNAVIASRTPDMMYVPAIIGRRPTVSKKRPSRSGPRKLPTAKGMM